VIALLRASAGLIVWAFAFCLLYSLHGIGCAARWPSITVLGGLDLHRFALIAAWLACIVANIAITLAVRRPRKTLIDRLAWRSALVGLGATVVTGLPILLLPACL